MNGTVCLKEFLGHQIGSMTFMSRQGESYVTDQFLVNLALLMNGRTLDETARTLLEIAYGEESGLPILGDGARTMETSTFVVSGLRYIVAYFAKLGFVENTQVA